jgi:hypothetical protein
VLEQLSTTHWTFTVVVVVVVVASGRLDHKSNTNVAENVVTDGHLD